MKKSWPVIRKAKRPGTGEKAWLVDGRFNRAGKSFGRRHYCDTETEAAELARQLKIQRGNEGARVFEATGADLEELRAARERLASCAREGETLADALAELAAARALLAEHGKTVSDAAAFLAAHLSERRRLKARTVRETVAELLSAKKSEGLSARYLTDLRLRLEAFAVDHGGRMIADVDKGAVDRWLAGLKVTQKGRAGLGGPLSATSRNNFRRVLGVLFSFALDRGYCPENSAAKAAKAKAVGGEVGILTVGQTAELLARASVDLVPFVAIGAFAGLRRAEIERLDWSEIDLADGLIEVKASKAKTARRRFVHVSENLAAWLRPLAKTAGPVVPVSPDELRGAFESARKAAGIVEWPANALRHSFASYHLAAHRDAAALALELGHTDSALLFEHYRQLVKPAEAAAYWRILPADDAAGKVVPLAKATA